MLELHGLLLPAYLQHSSCLTRVPLLLWYLNDDLHPGSIFCLSVPHAHLVTAVGGLKLGTSPLVPALPPASNGIVLFIPGS